MVMVDSDLRSIVPGVGRAPRRADPQGRLRLRRAAVRALQVRRHDHQRDQLPADPRALRRAHPPADRRRLRRLGGDLVARYLELDTFDELTARFGIDIWMTHSALNEGFASARRASARRSTTRRIRRRTSGRCSAQVVGTLFKLAGHYEDRWLRVRRLARDPRVRVRAGGGSGADQRRPRQADRQLRERATRAARRVGRDARARAAGAGHDARRRRARRPRSTSPRSCGSAAFTTPSSPTTGPGPTMSGSWRP